MAVADQKLFLGQVFSDFLLAIDLETSAIVKRIDLPGGGDGSITSSPDGRTLYFASNRLPRFFAIDSPTYELDEVPYPGSSKGSLCALAHPFRPILYIGIQRGGSIEGTVLPGGNSFLAVYDLEARKYVAEIHLSEVVNGVSDWSMPVCLTYDHSTAELFVGMFQSRQGIYRINTESNKVIDWLSPQARDKTSPFEWVDPLSQALYKDLLLSVNRHNFELAVYDRKSGKELKSYELGKATEGPNDLVVLGDTAVVCYPDRHGLLFVDLKNISS